MIAQFLRLISQIIRVYTDTVTAHKTGHEFQEVPLRSCGIQHRLSVDIHLVKDHGQFVHKCNVDIPLAVFNYLRGFRHLDGFRAVYARLHHQFIYSGYGIQRLLVHAGYDLRDSLQSVNLVPGIDPFRRITDLEILPAF